MLNQCNFIGNLGADPEVKHTAAGNTVANFNLAATEKWKDKNGQQQEETEWVRVVAWGRLADIIGEFLHKGSRVYISGKMKTRSWEDQSGGKRYVTEIVAREMKLLDRKEQRQERPQQEASRGYSAPDMGENVPFAPSF